jgi:hypothetical protein
MYEAARMTQRLNPENHDPEYPLKLRLPGVLRLRLQPT